MANKVWNDPQEVRRFAAHLKSFAGNLRDQTSGLRASLHQLGDEWRDQEHQRFLQVFEETFRNLQRFQEASEEHHGYLLRKAEKLDDYLHQR